MTTTPNSLQGQPSNASSRRRHLLFGSTLALAVALVVAIVLAAALRNWRMEKSRAATAARLEAFHACIRTYSHGFVDGYRHHGSPDVWIEGIARALPEIGFREVRHEGMQTLSAVAAPSLRWRWRFMIREEAAGLRLLAARYSAETNEKVADGSGNGASAPAAAVLDDTVLKLIERTDAAAVAAFQEQRRRACDSTYPFGK
jgi:hypothetical protein